MITHHLYISLMIAFVGLILMAINSQTKEDTGFLAGLTITLLAVFYLVILAITI